MSNGGMYAAVAIHQLGKNGKKKKTSVCVKDRNASKKWSASFCPQYVLRGKRNTRKVHPLLPFLAALCEKVCPGSARSWKSVKSRR